ncbi:hypothetical protein VM98_36065, partial [Streptomyces rubellomurinus subsp. indigoferus]
RGTHPKFIVEQTPAYAVDADAPGRPEVPEQPERPVRSDVPLSLTVSGRTGVALSAQADRLARHLAAHSREAGVVPSALGHALLRGRTRFHQTAVVLARTGAEALRGLTALAHG